MNILSDIEANLAKNIHTSKKNAFSLRKNLHTKEKCLSLQSQTETVSQLRWQSNGLKIHVSAVRFFPTPLQSPVEFALQGYFVSTKSWIKWHNNRQSKITLSRLQITAVKDASEVGEKHFAGPALVLKWGRPCNDDQNEVHGTSRGPILYCRIYS